MPRAHRVRLVAALALCTSGLARADGRELFLREEGAVGEAPEGAVLPSITPDAADQSPVVAREAILRARELFLASSVQEATRVLRVAIDTTIAALARCRRELAGFKQPKGICFLAFEAFPRSASGKVQRHELEKKLAEAGLTFEVERAPEDRS